jgi:hypothetical protein
MQMNETASFALLLSSRCVVCCTSGPHVFGHVFGFTKTLGKRTKKREREREEGQTLLNKQVEQKSKKSRF